MKGAGTPMHSNTIRLHTSTALAVSVFGLVFAEVSAHAQAMNAKERKGTNISSQWRGSTGLVTRGADGKVIFLFGEVQPSVVCSPLEVCDIELQAGEVVR